MEITFLMSLNGEFGVQKELYEMKPLHNYKMKEALINKCIKVLVNKFCDQIEDDYQIGNLKSDINIEIK